MTGAVRSAGLTLATAAVTIGLGCQLPRPTTVPGRMIEPQLVEPARDTPVAATPLLVRLLETQSRAHIGRRLLHRQPDGELTEDPVWHWSSAPDRYLDTALRLEMGASPNVRLVDAASAPVMVATLLEWQVEYGSETKLVGAVEVRFTGIDHAVRTQVIRATEPVSGELPGTLAAAAGRLLRRLASDALTSVVQNR